MEWTQVKVCCLRVLACALLQGVLLLLSALCGGVAMCVYTPPRGAEEICASSNTIWTCRRGHPQLMIFSRISCQGWRLLR